jgi:hypothetical protein
LPVAQEILELAERPHQHAQLVIGLAGHQVAFHDFGEIGDGGFELGEVPVILLIEPDAHKGGDRQADGLGIDQRDVTRNDTAGFQLADAAQAGAGRQANLVRQFLIGHSTIGLQRVENSAVDLIQRICWHDLVPLRP